MNENKFDGMGKVYSRFRPNYPQAFIDCLFGNVGVSKNSVIADIGSGTGILTKQLLERGNTVYAVEPNADMRAVAESDLSEFENFISISGTAENTTLPESSIDFITVAQAFHWFDRKAFKDECRRILKPNGKVILVWNSRDEKSEIVAANDEINRRYCPDYKGFSGGIHTAAATADFSDFFTGDYEAIEFENPLPFSERDFIGRNLSSSYALKEEDENYSDYIGELEEMFHKFSRDGILAMPNLTDSYIGKVF